MSTPAPVPIGPVYLVTGEPESMASTVFEIAMQALVVGAIVLLIVAAALIIAMRLRRAAAAMDPADLAFRSLAARMRLRRADRAALRRLAATPVPGWPPGVHPVALLVSRHAFETASAFSELHRAEGTPSLRPDVLDRLRRRAFGVCASASAAPG